MDRITINAFYPLGQTGGGIRSWWRNWKGSDQGLSDAGMKALAGEFGRRLKAWCGQHRIPFIDCHAGDDKHQIAQSLLPKDPKFQGLFAVLVAINANLGNFAPCALTSSCAKRCSSLCWPALNAIDSRIRPSKWLPWTSNTCCSTPK